MQRCLETGPDKRRLVMDLHILSRCFDHGLTFLSIAAFRIKNCAVHSNQFECAERKVLEKMKIDATLDNERFSLTVVGYAIKCCEKQICFLQVTNWK